MGGRGGFNARRTDYRQGGGLKGYAEGVGYDSSSVSKYRNAATVYREFINGNVPINDKSINGNEPLLDKTNHLGEIHKAPRDCWRVLVELLLSKDWTVADTRKAVITANSFEIPLQWQCVFLSLPQIVYRAVDTLEFSAKTVARIIESVEAIESRIATYKTRVHEFIWEFRVWLKAHAGADSWDTRKVVEYGRMISIQVAAPSQVNRVAEKATAVLEAAQDNPALAYPDKEKGGRGKKSKLNLEFSAMYLSQARFVLRHCRDKAEEVLRNAKYPLTVAYEEAQAIVEEPLPMPNGSRLARR